MFIIKWRRKTDSYCTTGLTRYPSKEMAEQQVGKWKKLFRQNEYFIEPT